MDNSSQSYALVKHGLSAVSPLKCPVNYSDSNSKSKNKLAISENYTLMWGSSNVSYETIVSTVTSKCTGDNLHGLFMTH